MKTVVLAVAGIGLGVLLVSGAVAGASALGVQTKPHAFANMGAPLWTFTPVYLDRNNQTAPAILAARKPTPEGSAAMLADMEAQAASPQATSPRVNTAHVDWCAQRYRSYRAEDNTYRSYSGTLRTCQSPFEVKGETTLADVGTDDGLYAALPDDAASSWCKARYRSYRASDNTYQPYGGGRRPCMPPAGMASINE
ncbi:BA14K-like protein [Rhizobium sp. RU20A]|uniref:BA14K family protein n=1 Tax=Rhizobium sp. RU20A TaxID=1907412 RepID=UPI000953C616|nr:BA14K family protein [Rhizobium sp. RU20A]SIQ89104.1 BA14K-like protein [Rhizobium sp. RU20A]